MKSRLKYACGCKIGLLLIAPHRKWSSLVELWINGVPWAAYPSAKTAAAAVSSGKTHHKDLDTLPLASRPTELADWVWVYSALIEKQVLKLPLRGQGPSITRFGKGLLLETETLFSPSLHLKWRPDCPAPSSRIPRFRRLNQRWLRENRWRLDDEN